MKNINLPDNQKNINPVASLLSGYDNYYMTLAALNMDKEKTIYAIEAMKLRVKNILPDCNNADCNKCDKDNCQSKHYDAMTKMIDVKNDLNLSDNEFIEAYLIAYNQLFGLPAQPVSLVVDNQGYCNIPASFGFDVNNLKDRLLKELVDQNNAEGVNMTDKFAIFDLIQYAVNQDGISYVELIALLLNYINMVHKMLLDNNIVTIKTDKHKPEQPV